MSWLHPVRTMVLNGSRVDPGGTGQPMQVQEVYQKVAERVKLETLGLGEKRRYLFLPNFGEGAAAVVRYHIFSRACRSTDLQSVDTGLNTRNGNSLGLESIYYNSFQIKGPWHRG